MSEYQAGMPDDDVRDVIRDVMAKQSLADRIEIHLSELLCAASANEDTLREPVAALVRMIDERIDERARAVVESAEVFENGEPKRVPLHLRVPREQTPDPRDIALSAELDACGFRAQPSLSRTVGREVGAGVGGKDAAAVCCGDRSSAPAPQRGTATGAPSEPDDEAMRIARTCCADIHQERCASEIRALVASKLRSAVEVERHRAAGILLLAQFTEAAALAPKRATTALGECRTLILRGDQLADLEPRGDAAGGGR